MQERVQTHQKDAVKLGAAEEREAELAEIRRKAELKRQQKERDAIAGDLSLLIPAFISLFFFVFQVVPTFVSIKL